MSIELMTMVWKTSLGPPTRRLVLLALADAANDEGVCWPAMSTIARKANCGVSTARRAVQELENEGVLTRTLRPVDKKRNQSNWYQIDRAALAALTPAQIERESNLSATPPQIEREVPPSSSGTPAQIERGNRKKNHQLEPSEETTPPGDDGSAAGPDSEIPAFSADQVVAAYIDSFRLQSKGRDPVGRYIAQVGREAKKMITEGQDPAVLLQAASALGRTPYATLERQVTMVLAGQATGGGSWRGDVDEFGRGKLDATRMSQEAARHWEEQAQSTPPPGPVYTDEWYAQQAESGPAF